MLKGDYMAKKAKMKYQISVWRPLSSFGAGDKVIGKFATKKQAERAFEKGLGTKFVTGSVQKIPTPKKTKFSIFGKKFKVQL